MKAKAPDPENTVIVIPARMASERLPGKPLADIRGVPMIVQVWRRAMESRQGRVIVAVAEAEIATAVTHAGGEAVLTDPALPSGSDRVHQAVALADPQCRFGYVVNLQGDLPTLDPLAILRCLDVLHLTGADLSTLAARIEDEAEVANPNVVKAVARLEKSREGALADDFVRTLPEGAKGPHWHHIGIYAYRRPALERFIALPQSVRERARRLEQMRALDNGMTIAIGAVDTVPLGVDTPEDLDKARAALKNAL